MVATSTRLSPRQAAKTLKISEASLLNHHARGRISAIRNQFGALRFTREEIRAFENRYIFPSANQQALDHCADRADQSLRHWREENDVGHLATAIEELLRLFVKLIGQRCARPVVSEIFNRGLRVA